MRGVVPITYQIDVERRTVRTKCVGPVMLPDVIHHFRTLVQDPQCPDQADVFLDVSEVSSLPGTPQISSVVSQVKKIRGKLRFDALAILVTRDALFGMMRMFEALAQDYFRVTRTFRVAAEAWLALQQSASQHGPADEKE